MTSPRERIWIEEKSKMNPWGITMFKDYENEKGQLKDSEKEWPVTKEEI